nr:CDP-alcohol phosphatidyltransferase family protein [Chloroflexota bacterium]
MLSDKFRNWTRALSAFIARLLGRLGVPPNALTVLGYLLHLPVMYELAIGHLRLGGILLALASIFDNLDGSLAREMEQVTIFGAFLDSVTDRFSEGTVLAGLLLWYVQGGAKVEIVLVYAALFGSLMVSYTRARAEGVGVACKEGLFTRFERVIVLVAGLILQQAQLTLWVLAVLTNVTALQRIYHVWQKTRSR